jgi:hypothetical protein
MVLSKCPCWQQKERTDMKRLVVALSLAMLVSLALGAAAYAASGSDSARGTVDQGT